MAEGTSVYQDNIICRYFLSGICKDGEKCLFSHDRTRHIPDSVCRYYLQGTCAFGQNCRYDHIFINDCTYAPEFAPRHIRSCADIVEGEINNEESICPLFAEKAYLHPFNEEARKSHIEKCEKRLEQELKYSFDIQDSMKKTCGICGDVVLKKEPVSERRFGILENCNHVYCLNCIRKWRQTRPSESNQTGIGFDPLVTRACPECHIVSDFITPSAYFVDTREAKQKLISEYKKTLGKTHCKYFNKGAGVCRLGGLCFYLHAKPDGTMVDLPLPERRSMKNEDGELEYLGGTIYFWNYFEYQEENSLFI